MYSMRRKIHEAANDGVTSDVHLCAGMVWDTVYVTIDLEGPVERANHRRYIYLLREVNPLSW